MKQTNEVKQVAITPEMVWIVSLFLLREKDDLEVQRFIGKKVLFDLLFQTP